MATISTRDRIAAAAVRLFAETGSTRVTVAELADAAGVARGTIYNNVDAPERLFEEIAAQLADQMHERIAGTTKGPRDPAVCLANGLRLFVRQAHEQPHWGSFILRFGLFHAALRGMWEGQPSVDLINGLESGRYRFDRQQLPSILAMIAGAGLSAMFLVREGHTTWRDAGTNAAELVLRALGVDPDEAGRIARSELPPLDAS